ncbi:MAG: hypothetical protein A2X94_01395 [Bdellovibrionales bacterium GWB1_55_8]|nr:MAG: hypothetical protein A2X94_01395 [Bdellovibrionales bacterium GWB1_55_8]
MLQRTLAVGPFQANCHLVACPKSGELAIIDPGEEPAQILEAVMALEKAAGLPLKPKFFLHTHAHLDHISAAKELLKSFSAKVALHAADEPIWRGLRDQARAFGLEYGDPASIDLSLEDGQELSLGALKITVIHTPGHSPGGVCFLVTEEGAKSVLYTGDTLFLGSIGRADLWGGDMDQLVRSIQEKLLVLDPATIVKCGHGPDTTIGRERLENPYL